MMVVTELRGNKKENPRPRPLALEYSKGQQPELRVHTETEKVTLETQACKSKGWCGCHRL